jgi:hypothetical protein
MNALGLPAILRVKGFAEIPESNSWMLSIWDKYTWQQEGDFLSTADRELDLGGELLQYVAAHGITWLPQRPEAKSNTAGFLNAQSENGLYQAWSESTKSGLRYTVFVDYRDHSKAIKANKLLKQKAKELLLQAMAREVFELKNIDQESKDKIIAKCLTKVMFQCGISHNNIALLTELIPEFSYLP